MIDKDGRKIGKGDEITDFRGESWIVVDFSGPNKIYVSNMKQPHVRREFYISVFDLTHEEDKTL